MNGQRKTISELVVKRNGSIEDVVRIMTDLAQAGIKKRKFTEEEFEDSLRSVWFRLSKRPDYSHDNCSHMLALAGPETAMIFAIEPIEKELAERFRDKSADSYRRAAAKFIQLYPDGIPDYIAESPSERIARAIAELVGQEVYDSLSINLEENAPTQKLVGCLAEIANKPFEESDWFRENYEQYKSDIRESLYGNQEALPAVRDYEKKRDEKKAEWEKKCELARQLIRQIESIRTDYNPAGDGSMQPRFDRSIDDTIYFAVYRVEDRVERCYRISFLLPIEEPSIMTDTFSGIVYFSLVQATKNYGVTTCLQQRNGVTRMDLVYNPDQKEQVHHDFSEIVEQTMSNLQKGILGNLGYRINIENIGEVNS